MVKKDTLKRQFFIAVMPPPEVAKKLADLARKGPGHWDWKKAADLHISLAFPGRLTDTEVTRLCEVLETVEADSFDLSFDGLGYFFSDPMAQKKRDRHVLWARPENHADNALRLLHHRISAKLRSKGFPFGRSDITPHITLARTEQESIRLMQDFVHAHGTFATETYRCSRFALCESLPATHENHPDNNGGRGSRYKVIAEFKLK